MMINLEILRYIKCKKTEAEKQQINSIKIKNDNGFVYKTVINREIIYEYFLNKVKDVNSTCIITWIYCENGEIWEKIVYINNEESNAEQKIIEQFRFFILINKNIYKKFKQLTMKMIIKFLLEKNLFCSLKAKKKNWKKY